VEDADNGEDEALAGEGGGVRRVDRGGGPMWGADATVTFCFLLRVDCGRRCW
jgi:hypothetical protein